MLLVTTADQHFWRTDQKILFLGEWCKLFSEKQVWEKLNCEVLPYHWDDREKLYRDFTYIEKLYEDFLLHFSTRLNEIHHVDHSPRYWRIIVGPWLYFFIGVFFDRYETILVAERSGKADHTLIGQYDQIKWVMSEAVGLTRACETDEYNQLLYSYILRHRNQINFESIDISTGIDKLLSDIHPEKRATGFSLARFSRNCISQLGKWIPERFNRIVFATSTIPTEYLARLQMSLGQFPFLYPPIVPPPHSTMNMTLRETIGYPFAKNEFETVLAKIIGVQMPTVYLEGYHEMESQALEVYPKNPKLIFTACSFEVDEAFKFWTAHQVDRGCKLLGSQHGHNYGASKWFIDEDHQIKVCDQYYTWGWDSEKYNNTKPFPTGKFSRIPRLVNSDPKGNILFVTYAWPRYAYKLYSVPVSSSGMLSYLNDQFKFVRTLLPQVRDLLQVRLFPNDRKWSQAKRWSEQFPNVSCCIGKPLSIPGALQKSRLLVTASNGTSCLEGFLANFPTVLIWNRNYFELRPSAQPYFDELAQVGILHETPDSAARKVNEIFADPLSWWQQPEIQLAKDRFCEQFAKTSDSWLKEWKKELLKVAGICPSRDHP